MTIERLKIVDSVSSFSLAMTEKMVQKAEEGFTGWDNKDNNLKFLADLNEKVKQINQGDYSQCVDAANYLMMLNNFRNAG